MTRYLAIVRRKRNIRRVFGGLFLIVFALDIGSHASACYQYQSNGTLLSWCKELHHTSPSADCPHKRHPGLPSSAVQDEVSHHTALLQTFIPEFTGVVFNLEPLDREPVIFSSRTLTPPSQPPKQS